MVKRRRPLFGVTLIAILAIVDLALLLQMVKPDIESATLTFGNREPVAVTLPLQEMMDLGTFRMTMSMKAASLHATRFTVIPDNCIRGLTVNGKPIPMSLTGACDYDRGLIVDLSDVLRRGDNIVTADLWNGGGVGGLTMHTAHTDPLVLAILLSMCAIIIAYVALLARRAWPKNATRAWIASLFVAGVMVRLFYVSATPHTVRGHDYDGHLEYIEYIAENGALPRANFNKQTYHPPLYHLLGAAAWAGGTAAGLEFLSLTKVLQILSLVLSALTLAIGIAAGSLVLGGGALVLFAAGLAAFPALVLIAPQINNDALFQLWTILAVALLLRWWTKATAWRWAAFVLVVLLGIVTKSNALAVAVAGGVCVLARPGLSWKPRITFLALLCAGLLLSGAMIAGISRQAEVEDGFVGNASSLTNIVPNQPRYLLTFNPAAMFITPYNNPFEATHRKDYALEFYFRSVLFGEYQFGPRLIVLARVMLVLALLLLPALLAQCIGDLFSRRSRTYPLAIVTVTGLAAMAAFRILLPVSSAQDFRYTLFLAVPICVYLASPRGLPKALRTPTSILFAAMIVCSAVFYMTFSLSS